MVTTQLAREIVTFYATFTNRIFTFRKLYFANMNKYLMIHKHSRVETQISNEHHQLLIEFLFVIQTISFKHSLLLG